MKYLFLLALTLFASFSIFGQTLQRQDHETAALFVKRLMPDTLQLAHPVVETSIWSTITKAIIALYGYDDPKDVNTGFNTITGHIYLPTDSNSYRDISFGEFNEEGGYPEVISIFFVNADKDQDKELAILCRWDQRHYDYSGAFYDTFIFDNPVKESNLHELTQFNRKFFGCECGWREGKSETAKFKTAKEVKAALTKMGFKQ